MTIDRIAPTRRPDLSNDGTQTWRELLFVHWSVDVDAMREVVPKELELDLHEGKAFVGCVPFVMKDIRSKWMPRFAGLNFLETNLRTYVTYRDRPGVYFFSLEASSRLAVKVARFIWKLPYFHATMTRHEAEGVTTYETVRRSPDAARLFARYRVGEALGPSAPGSLEHFLLERYLLFSLRDGEVLEGHVHHIPYPAHRAEVLELEESLVEAAGLPKTQGLPELAHFSPGVDVEVFGPFPADRRG